MSRCAANGVGQVNLESCSGIRINNYAIRHGTRCLIASFIVPTGKVLWDRGVICTSLEFAAHLDHVATQFVEQQRFH
jgi:hypothetical protein